MDHREHDRTKTNTSPEATQARLLEAEIRSRAYAKWEAIGGPMLESEKDRDALWYAAENEILERKALEDEDRRRAQDESCAPSQCDSQFKISGTEGIRMSAEQARDQSDSSLSRVTPPKEARTDSDRGTGELGTEGADPSEALTHQRQDPGIHREREDAGRERERDDLAGEIE